MVEERPKPGTPIFIVKAYLPAMEHFGFETDLRYHTQVRRHVIRGQPQTCAHGAACTTESREFDRDPGCVTGSRGSCWRV